MGNGIVGRKVVIPVLKASPFRRTASAKAIGQLIKKDPQQGYGSFLFQEDLIIGCCS
jgi:hypothetical protein